MNDAAQPPSLSEPVTWPLRLVVGKAISGEWYGYDGGILGEHGEPRKGEYIVLAYPADAPPSAEQITCVLCKGAGSIEVDHRVGEVDFERIDVNCPACGGTGAVSAEQIRREEREAIIKLIEDRFLFSTETMVTASELAAAIRKREET